MNLNPSSSPSIFNCCLSTKLTSFPAAYIFLDNSTSVTTAKKQSVHCHNRKLTHNEGLSQHHFVEAQSLCSTKTVLFASPHEVLPSKNIINQQSKLLSTVHNWNLFIPPAGLKIIASLSRYEQQTELKASHFAFGVSLSKVCQLSKWNVSIICTLSKNKVSLFLLGRKRTLKGSTVKSRVFLHE